MSASVAHVEVLVIVQLAFVFTLHYVHLIEFCGRWFGFLASPDHGIFSSCPFFRRCLAWRDLRPGTNPPLRYTLIASLTYYFCECH